jgi:selenocysteine lyase/cysteine desulfurase
LEAGTQAHELLAGVMGTFEYLEWLGTTVMGAATGSRAERLHAAIGASRTWERDLVRTLIAEVGQIPGVRIRGITDPSRADERCPTIAFTIDGHHPREIAAFLGARGISTWDGDYYAWELIRALGLAESGGMVRVGLVHYNTPQEVERLVDALRELVSGR